MSQTDLKNEMLLPAGPSAHIFQKINGYKNGNKSISARHFEIGHLDSYLNDVKKVTLPSPNALNPFVKIMDNILQLLLWF